MVPSREGKQPVGEDEQEELAEQSQADGAEEASPGMCTLLCGLRLVRVWRG